MAKTTMPAQDSTGRKPPAQPRMPNSRPAQPPAKRLAMPTRDPRRKRG
jgi:hypothetical protein